MKPLFFHWLNSIEFKSAQDYGEHKTSVYVLRIMLILVGIDLSS